MTEKIRVHRGGVVSIKVHHNLTADITELVRLIDSHPAFTAGSSFTVQQCGETVLVHRQGVINAMTPGYLSIERYRMAESAQIPCWWRQEQHATVIFGDDSQQFIDTFPDTAACVVSTGYRHSSTGFRPGFSRAGSTVSNRTLMNMLGRGYAQST